MTAHATTRLPAYEGHFPGDPIVPGAAILAWVERASGARFTRLERVRFVAIARPGDEVSARYTTDGAKLAFVVERGETTLARGTAWIDVSPSALDAGADAADRRGP